MPRAGSLQQLNALAAWLVYTKLAPITDAAKLAGALLVSAGFAPPQTEETRGSAGE